MGGPQLEVKSFEIPKRLVFEALTTIPEIPHSRSTKFPT